MPAMERYRVFHKRNQCKPDKLTDVVDGFMYRKLCAPDGTII